MPRKRTIGQMYDRASAKAHPATKKKAPKFAPEASTQSPGYGASSAQAARNRRPGAHNDMTSTTPGEARASSRRMIARAKRSRKRGHAKGSIKRVNTRAARRPPTRKR